MSYNNNVLGQSGSIFFFGVIEDNNDPEKLGRVKVRVHGVHSPDKGILPTEILPWASVSLPVTSNETSMPDLYPGTTVFGFFLDGDEMQVPFITGIVPGLGDDDQPTIAAGRAAALAKKNSAIFDQPVGPDTAQYPHNRATVTKSGHVIEYDDTPGAERIMIFHTSGAFIEMRPDGTIVQKSKGDQFILASGKQSVKADGPVAIESSESLSVKAGGDGSIEASGPLSVKSDAALALAGAGAALTLADGMADLSGGMNSSGIVTASDVIGGGYSLAQVGAAIDAGGGLDALAAAGGIIGLINNGLNGLDVDTGGWGSTDLTPPPAGTALLNFTASGSITNIVVSHDLPTFTEGGGYKSTHIFTAIWVPGQPRPILADATIAHTFTGIVSSFDAQPGKRYIVWAKVESKAGVFSDAFPDEIGLLVETGQDVAALSDLIRQQIFNSDLYQLLRSELGINDLADSVAQNATVTQAEILRRREEVRKEQQARVDALIAEAFERGAAITTERTERQTAVSSLAQTTTTLTAAVGANAAAIQQEAIARADAISAEATLRETLAVRVGDAESAIVTDRTARINGDQANADLITALTSTVNGNQATVTQALQTEVDARTALASDVTTLTSRVGTAEGTLTTTATALATLDGNVSTQYAVRTRVSSGGRTVVGGFGLIGSTIPGRGPEIEFGVSADRFWIGAPQATVGVPDTLPFVVQATEGTTPTGDIIPVGVYINEAYIKNGTITNAKIGTLDAGKITTGFLSAARIEGGTIDAGKLNVAQLSAISTNLGAITSGSLDINNGVATISNLGHASFKSLEVLDASGQAVLSVTPTNAAFKFPSTVLNVPEYIANSSIYVDTSGNLQTGVPKSPTDPLNLIDYSSLTLGTNLPTGWAKRENVVGETTVINTPLGPAGIPSNIIRVSDQDVSTGADGGFQATPNIIPIGGAKYRIIQPIRRVSGTTGLVYIGISPSVGAGLERVTTNAGVATGNPYFNIVNMSALPVDEWCIAITYVLPSGTATPATVAEKTGIYKLSDGTLVDAAETTAPYILNAAGNTLGFGVRAFLDSSTVIGTTVDFACPYVHECDGTEPAIDTLFKGMNLRTFGYSGDLDATKGAPAGTLVGGVTAESIATSTNNFNARNDRNASAIVVPTIDGTGLAVDHTILANGSADISFEWNWTGTESDIDGFRVYVYQSSAATAYTFGTTPSAETVYELPANKRAFALFGVNPTTYYTFGVQAYRVVDPDVNAAGVITTAVIKPSLASENPYRPSASIAFQGDITGTVNGTLSTANVNNWNFLAQAPYASIYNNDDSVALGFNPTFGDWPTASLYPTGWSLWSQNAGSTITKETNSLFVRSGVNSLKMVCTGGSTGLVRGVAFNSNPLPAGTFLQGTVDIYIDSVTSGRPGILVRLWGEAGAFNLTTGAETKVQPSNSTTGIWHRLPWSIRLPSDIGQIYQIQIYLMGSWPTFSTGAFTGTCYIDNLRFMVCDKTTDNIQLKLTESAGVISIANGGLGSVTTITQNNKLTGGNVGLFVADQAITSAKVGKYIGSDDFNGLVDPVSGLITNDGTRGWVIAKGDGTAGSNRMIIDNMTVRQKITTNQIEVGAIDNSLLTGQMRAIDRNISWEFGNATVDFINTKIEGWQLVECSWDYAVDPYSTVVLTSQGTNQHIISPTISISGATNPIIRLKIRRRSGSGWQGKIYYSTAGHGFTESFYKINSFNPPIGEWVELDFDMRNLNVGGNDWSTNTITGIRIHLGNTIDDDFHINFVNVGSYGSFIPRLSTFTNTATGPSSTVRISGNIGTAYRIPLIQFDVPKQRGTTIMYVDVTIRYTIPNNLGITECQAFCNLYYTQSGVEKNMNTSVKTLYGVKTRFNASADQWVFDKTFLVELPLTNSNVIVNYDAAVNAYNSSGSGVSHTITGSSFDIKTKVVYYPE